MIDPVVKNVGSVGNVAKISWKSCLQVEDGEIDRTRSDDASEGKIKETNSRVWFEFRSA